MGHSKNRSRYRSFRRVVAILVSAFLLLQSGTYTGVIKAQAGPLLSGVIDDGVSVLLFLNGTALSDDDVVTSSDELLIQYIFSVTGDKADDMRESTVGGSVSFPVSVDLSAGLVWLDDVETELLSEDGVKYGTLSVESGNALLTFVGDFWRTGSVEAPEAERDLENVSISIRCILDMGEIKTDADYQLSFIGGGTLDLVIGDSNNPGYKPAKLASLVDKNSLKVSLVLDDGTANGQVLNNRDSVSSSDSLFLRYEFEITDDYFNNSENADYIRTLVHANDSSADPDNLAGDGSYAITILVPDGLSWIEKTGQDTLTVLATDVFINEDDEEPTELFWGTLHIENGVATLTFEGNFWYNEYFPSLKSAFLEIGCGLNLSKIGSALEYNFHFEDESELTLGIPDNGKKNELSKKGVYDANTQEITWTLTYKPGAVSASELPISIVDTFGTEFQSYVPDSFSAPADVNGTLNDSNAASGKIIYTMQTVPAGQVVFTYRTALTSAVFNEANLSSDTIVSNSADLTDEDGNSLLAALAYHEVTIPAKSKKWIEKSLVNGYPSYSVNDYQKNYAVAGDKEYKWEVVVTTYGVGISALTLFDTIPAGHSLVPGTVKIDGSSVGIDSTSTDTFGNTTFGINLPKDGSGYERTYTVTYTTKIDDVTFLHTDLDDTDINTYNFINKAWLEFKWESGNAGPKPAYSVGIGVDNHIIHKSGSTYNAEDNTITWTVTVNPYGLYVKGGTITEDLTKSFGSGNVTTTAAAAGYLTYDYLDGSFSLGAGVSDTDLKLDTENSNDKMLKIIVGEIGTREVTFTFVTTVDSDYLLHNHSTVTNIVDFDGKVLIGGNEKDVTDSASDPVDHPSTVLSKHGAGYDYDKNIITWRIEIDHNKVNLGAVTLEDTITAPQSFVTGSVYIGTDSSPLVAAASSPYYNGLSFANDKLTVNLKNVNTKIYVTFQTKVDVGAVSAFKSDTSASFSNTVKMTQSDGRYDTASGAQAVSNNVLSKSYGTIKDGVIPFSVNIDAARAAFVPGLDCVLTDTIPNEMILDIDSVILYKAENYTSTSDSATYDIKRSEANPVYAVFGTDYTWTYESDQNGNKLILTLLRAGRYVLEYDCYIVTINGKTVKNRIELTGNSMASAMSNASSQGITLNGGGATSAGTVAALNLTKQDADTSASLSNAEFQLMTKFNGKDIVVQTAKTDANGKLTFFPLRAGREYWIVETKASSLDYDSSSAMVITEDGQEIAAKALSKYLFNVKGGVPKAITVTNENTTRIQPKIQIKKTDIYGRPLAGAAFELLKNGTEIVTLTPDSSGAVFTSEENGLRMGSYTLREISAPANYQTIVGDIATFEVDSNGDIVYVSGAIPVQSSDDLRVFVLTVSNMPKIMFMNAPINPSMMQIKLQIKKTDGKGDPLPGASFTLTKNGTYTETLTANPSGDIFTSGNLSVGTYELIEKSAPSGYQPVIGIVSSFSIDALGNITHISGANLTRLDSSTFEIVVQNSLQSFSPARGGALPKIRIKKTDDTGNLLTGASFELIKDGMDIIPLSPNSGGSIFMSGNLEAGLYTLRETSAPSGYHPITGDVMTFRVYAAGNVDHLGGTNLVRIGNTYVFETTVANNRIVDDADDDDTDDDDTNSDSTDEDSSGNGSGRARSGSRNGNANGGSSGSGNSSGGGSESGNTDSGSSGSGSSGGDNLGGGSSDSGSPDSSSPDGTNVLNNQTAIIGSKDTSGGNTPLPQTGVKDLRSMAALLALFGLGLVLSGFQIIRNSAKKKNV